ncbi:MoaD/ThiS family protein [Psychromicrobium lacuslunae]|uniref:Molybdenum cofactor biosynthesis protein MoaD n=1 Tax=Psychromicrobium lacuslunae TaxID=1618207 RepID=A0A0D4BWS1_9MICC|nr:MoaD/ThiS family protein [Psychromicrobium lacuslunae]AJT40560.1 molybdenum cofactor biosynthesis protein MoaD [Psychromicrobium lacuslunae]
MIVRYFAAARASVGVDQESLDLPSGTTFAQLLIELASRHPESASDSAPRLAELLPRCSFLGNEVVLREHSVQLSGDELIDVLPPFAGG